MPTRILVIGGGGREHALAWKLANEPGVNVVWVGPGNPGIAAEPRVRVMPWLDPLDANAIVALSRAEAIELVVIGPEAPLAAGVADALTAVRIPVFGPTRAAARIETSKAFCRDVAAAAGVPIARGAAFADLAPARQFAVAVLAGGDGVVIKADGLAAGKGVTVCPDLAAAELALEAIFGTPDRAGDRTLGGPAASSGFRDAAAAPRVVVEQQLLGREASLIALADGQTALALPAARDHKRLRDGDAGPNTGGMGAYSPVPDLPDDLAQELVARVHRPILAELARRGTPFHGALYAGLMLTPDGPHLLECNARFGDPETQVILPRLGVPLGPLMLAAAQGRLAGAAAGLGLTGSLLPATREATVGIVLAAADYPEPPRTGDAIGGLAQAVEQGALVFQAGTARDSAGILRTAGGRVLAVVGRGPDLDGARDLANRAADAVSFAGLQRRHDIASGIPGTAALPATVGAASR